MIPYIEMHIVDHCNLGCKGCSHFSGLSEPWFITDEDFVAQMKELEFLTKGNIPIIRIMGGEPLLHKHFVQYVVYTRLLFPDSQIVLVTNGILLPTLDQSYYDSLNQYDITVCISNYNLKIKLKDCLSKLKHYQIHDKGQMYNIGLDLEGTQDNITAFKNCDLAQHKWYFYKDFRLFPCCIMANIDIFCKYFNKEIQYELDDVGIDIRNHSLKEVEEFLSTPRAVCKYCNTDFRSRSYIDFAKSKKEIKEWICQ